MSCQSLKNIEGARNNSNLGNDVKLEMGEVGDNWAGLADKDKHLRKFLDNVDVHSYVHRLASKIVLGRKPEHVLNKP